MGVDTVGRSVALDAATGKVLTFSASGDLLTSSAFTVNEIPELVGLSRSGGQLFGWRPQIYDTSDLQPGDLLGGRPAMMSWSSPEDAPTVVRETDGFAVVFNENGGGRLPFRVDPGFDVDRRAIFTDGDAWQVLEYASGELARVLRLNRPRRPVTAATVAAYRVEIEERYPPGRSRDARLVVLEDPRVPEYLPAFDRVVLDQDRIWARRWDNGSGSRHAWDVFVEGIHVGVVRVPKALEVWDFDGEAVVGVWTDEFDVEYVRRYRLLEPAD